MSSEFDPSPRTSKRRKTTRYGGSGTSFDDETSPVESEPVNGAVGLRKRAHASPAGIGGALSAKQKPTSAVSRSQRNAPSAAMESSGGLRSQATDGQQDQLPVTPSKRTKRQKHTMNKAETANGFLVNDVALVPDGGNDNHTTVTELEEEEPTEPITQPRSSGRQRRAPRRLEDVEVQESAPKRQKQAKAMQEGDNAALASPVLKGILTPSKTQRTGPRKSVAFNQDEKDMEERFGFRDIETPGKAVTRKATVSTKRRTRDSEVRPSFIDPENQECESVDEDDDLAVEPVLHEPDVYIPIPTATLPSAIQKTTPVTQDDLYLHKIRSSVLSRLSCRTLPTKPPDHLLPQYTQLHSILHATVTSSESNSILLLGPRGAQKSTLVSLALAELSNTYANDFHTVHLSGFFQTDDRLALREIWRQLGYSRGLDEAETEDIGASYADTMSSLLSLLSHPDEVMVDGEMNGNSTQRTSKSIVFVLDEFDLFTTHPRQTLLYNLFEIAQSRKAPIAVVGCSTRMDVIECLEKRVKSRFSHRWVLVPAVKSMTEWEQCVSDALLVDRSKESGPKGTQDEERWVGRWNRYIKDTLLPLQGIQQLIKKHFYATKSLPDLFADLFPLIAALQLPAGSSSSVAPAVPSSSSILSAPTILETVPSLPVLHLSLLLSSCRLTTIHHLPTPNFNLVYAHYTELVAATRLKQFAGGAVATSGSLRKWTRETCRGAWEELAAWGLMVPVTGAGEDGVGRGALGGEGEEDTRMWRAEVGLEDLEWAIGRKFGIEGDGRGSGGTAEVLIRWCREV